MPKQTIIQNPLAEIRNETNIVYVLATQLEALARVLTHVKPLDEDQQPTLRPEDFIHIMQLFQRQLASLQDIADGVDGAVEAGCPGSLKAVTA